ncbi:hypothetical protein SDRG_11074 [Saprolegnia diclina VS20]|uniref:Uncharacterized protein n=1 Tax=Saprolegnia diclina (strain VS20) TaxID=1156394 RepID=T0Q906_SAPDV|nr:hypothetical protein SDRG_11074 [Saprolegnia diclina VS20]EQC31146.1 hypothetical protein SDRG_11074 [Saprolegnia diclina VS20]|eukprot:XP_008615319.1 hypothetical protein SDRG_11074 [Saprolegnia diclina VS20]
MQHCLPPPWRLQKPLERTLRWQPKMAQSFRGGQYWSWSVHALESLISVVVRVSGTGKHW